jgi:hypothetical protein
MSTATDLAARLADLLSRERVAMADFLIALSEFDRDRRWVELGHESLWAFLHRDLHLSAGAAQYRKTAAELLQRFPEVIEPLRDGRLCFSTIIELARVLTEENRAEVLPRFFHRSRRQAAEVAVEIQPRPVPLRTVVTAISPGPAARAFHLAEVDSPTGQVAASTMVVAGPVADPPTQSLTPCPATQPSAPLRASSKPLTAELSRLQVTVSRAFLKKLEQARAALSHSHPGASDAAILEVGLDLVLARRAMRRGLTAKPRKARPAAEATPVETSPAPGPAPGPTPGPAPGPTPAPALAPVAEGYAAPAPVAAQRPGEAAPPKPRSRWIPAAMQREVWLREGGCCQWERSGGGVCGSTLRLEVHHLDPWFLGGPPEADRLQLLCSFHHGLATREVFGPAGADRRSRAAGSPVE